MSQTMTAIVFNEYGDAGVLKQQNMPIPKVTENTIQIRVVAAAINPADISIRSGRFRLFLRLKFPFIPGADVAGIVTQVGSDVTKFKVGDAVFAMLPTGSGGAYTEYAVIGQDDAALTPESITYSQASAMPLAGLTALQALRDRAKLHQGQRVLIYGASGGVGTLAVQIAKAMNAHVTAVCSTRNLEMVQNLGADAIIDYTQQSITELDQQFDIVLDAVALLSLQEGLNLVKRGGVMVSLNPGMGNPISKMLARLRGKRIESLLVKPDGTDLSYLADLVDRGCLSPVIDRIYELRDAQQSHEYSETKRARGKIVLSIDDDLIEALATSKI